MHYKMFFMNALMIQHFEHPIEKQKIATFTTEKGIYKVINPLHEKDLCYNDARFIWCNVILFH